MTQRRIGLELRWRNLSCTKYQITSSQSQTYNCFAWAAEDTERWWQPIPTDQFYWPEGVPQTETLDAYVSLAWYRRAIVSGLSPGTRSWVERSAIESR